MFKVIHTWLRRYIGHNMIYARVVIWREYVEIAKSRRGRQVHVILQADHLGFRHKNTMLINPFQDVIKVPASVGNVEIRKGIFDSLHPVVSDHRHVATTHYVLSEHFDAMVWGTSKQDVSQIGNNIPTEMNAPEVFVGGISMVTPTSFAKHVLQKSEWKIDQPVLQQTMQWSWWMTSTFAM